MSEFRILLDNDMDKIIDFIINSEFKNGLDMYVSNHLNIDSLKNESTLRPLLFEGRLICFGEIKNDTLKQLAILSIPDCNFKSRVVNIYQISKDKVFINSFIKFIIKFLGDSNYSKLRISVIEDKNSTEFIEMLKCLGFVVEANLNGNLGEKKMLSIFFEEVINNG